ncbi:MAG: glycosyltransferase family 4 protein [Gemmatimonadota bacterium]
MRPTVISLLNTPAGRYAWYEEFPACLTMALADYGIDHIVGYKSYTGHSRIPSEARLVVHDDKDARDAARLRQTLDPIAAGREPVILHTHSYSFGPSRFRAVTNRHRRMAWWATIHRTPAIDRPKHRWLRGALQRAGRVYPDRVFGCSEATAGSLLNLFPSRMVGALVDGRLNDENLSRFEPRGVPRTAILVGRLVRGKGLDTALAAVALILPHVPDFTLIVVGEGAELGPARDRVHGTQLEAAVTFTGYQPNPDIWYQKADISWVPTDPALMREGLNLTALEAKGHALPTVYTLSGGLPETQIPLKTGIPIDPATPEQLARATLELLTDQPRYNAMRLAIVGERTRWSLDRMVQDYLREYLRHFGMVTPQTG